VISMPVITTISHVAVDIVPRTQLLGNTSSWGYWGSASFHPMHPFRVRGTLTNRACDRRSCGRGNGTTPTIVRFDGTRMVDQPNRPHHWMRVMAGARNPEKPRARRALRAWSRARRLSALYRSCQAGRTQVVFQPAQYDRAPDHRKRPTSTPGGQGKSMSLLDISPLTIADGAAR